MTAYAYATISADIAIHPSGWLRLPSGKRITCLPLLDTGGRGPLFCRGSETARAWLAQRGKRLASVESLRALQELCGGAGPGVHIEPYTLPDADLYARGFRPGDPAMSSVDWCMRHDREVMRRYRLADPTERRAVAGAGKQIAVDGSILGWSKRPGDPEALWIQPRSTRHVGHEQLDYATTVHAEDDGDDRDTVPDSAPTIARPTRRTLRFTRPLTQGFDVQAVQLAVGAQPDGWFGPATRALVIGWQRSHGLIADGIVGARTWAALDDGPARALPDPTEEPGPSAPLIRARNFTWADRQPRHRDVHMATIHTIQCPPRAGYARSNAQWFAGATAPNASVHWWVDPSGVVQGLEEQHHAWGAKSGPERHAQRYAIHVEHAGYTADPTRGIVATKWLTEGLAVLEQSAQLMASIIKRWDLLPERVDVERKTAWRDAIRRGDSQAAWKLRGIDGHDTWTRAYSVVGGHGDPEPWPWPEYLERVRGLL